MIVTNKDLYLSTVITGAKQVNEIYDRGLYEEGLDLMQEVLEENLQMDMLDGLMVRNHILELDKHDYIS